jgi:hypothetical protein
MKTVDLSLAYGFITWDGCTTSAPEYRVLARSVRGVVGRELLVLF